MHFEIYKINQSCIKKVHKSSQKNNNNNNKNYWKNCNFEQFCTFPDIIGSLYSVNTV